MNFRTTFNIPPADFPIQYAGSLVSLGSCFADLMGQRLSNAKFDMLANPFGTIFNPISLFGLLQADAHFFEPYFVEHQGIWYNYQAHSQCAATSREALAQDLGARTEMLQRYLQKSNYLIITLGTAWVYELTAQAQTVANCHKQPTKTFGKRLLGVEEIEGAFVQCYDFLQKINPSLNIILTVSPVRHLKDTLPLNAVSKSVLRLASHYISEKHKKVSYFPVYELLTDDLRDYRFYAPDMIHPSEVAENYIWEQFTQTYCRPETMTLMQQWHEIRRDLAHRPFLPESAAHQAFLQKLLQKLERIAAHLPVKEEMEQVRRQLI
ncbi:GSCFA family protein [Flexibacter flexilis DSM 6793]|uniref:GSCFA family protein n=1 Tax=Flexibacter flexilis DSM 6793 TaxID=927664 RepID=A0A1I1DTK8_9BACT|nr:GSCFA domain-containing protein [Flexibacter flexilis]SFB78295.1 GSCFA family protein [Flexibacter flexilis DSM 6793]